MQVIQNLKKAFAQPTPGLVLSTIGTALGLVILWVTIATHEQGQTFTGGMCGSLLLLMVSAAALQSLTEP